MVRVDTLPKLALDYLATAYRTQAAQVVTMSAVGFNSYEIASSMGLTVKGVKNLRDMVGDGVIEAMRDQGYADTEIIRTLGVPTGRVLESSP